MIRALFPALLLLGFARAPEVHSETRTPGERPNIILISLDTTRADYLSLYGYERNTTPNLDRLASRAVVFENARTVVPLTGPSHASVFTSLFPHQHGAFRNGIPLMEDWTTITDLLLRQGYDTAAFVSGWTMRKKICGLHHGFRHYDDTFTNRYKFVNRERYAEETTDAVEAFLGKQPLDSPLFLFVHYFDPHDPYRRHRGIFETFLQNANKQDQAVSRNVMKKRLAYASEIAYMDHQLGRLLGLLQAKGLLDHAVVIIFSDHGESLDEHDYWGHGRRVYEQTLHVPLLLYAPAWFPEEKRISGPVTTLDILPTLLSLLGIQPSDGPAMEGRDLTGHLLRGEPLLPDRLYFETFKGTLKRFTRLIADKTPKNPSFMGFVEGSVKYILKPESSKVETYDLARDPEELRDLSSKKDAVHPALHLRSWYREGLNDQAISVRLSREEIEKLRSLGYVD